MFIYFSSEDRWVAVFLAFQSQSFHTDRCCKCVRNCSQRALAYNLRKEIPEVIYKRIKNELKLLKNIGGVTLSGGEPMQQYLEVKELIKLCKEMGAYTAVETSGAVNIKCFEELLEYVDCWLFGLKQTDVEKCRVMMEL